MGANGKRLSEGGLELSSSRVMRISHLSLSGSLALEMSAADRPRLAPDCPGPGWPDQYRLAPARAEFVMIVFDLAIND